MTADAGVLTLISKAEAHIQNARRAWDPTSLSGCADCASELQAAIQEMNTACEAATTVVAVPDATARLQRLSGDVERLSRLVDAALAFGRGLALRSAPEEWAVSEVKG
jgi:hypothetical protein